MNIKCKEHFFSNNTRKPYLWVYWDNIDNTDTPPYIQLCHESMLKHCSEYFEIIFLNKNNIYIFLPELEKIKHKIDELIIPHKVDIYRIYLLYKYGGLYLDSDIIVLKNPVEIIEKLINTEYDFVGTGCTGFECEGGYGKPSNWLLASKPNTKLMKLCMDKINNIIFSNNIKIEYHDIGKKIIWESLEYLINNENYKYFHYPTDITGIRDKNKRWVNSYKLVSERKIEYENEDKMLFLVFYNSSESIKKIRKMTRNKLLSSKMNISRFYRKALID